MAAPLLALRDLVVRRGATVAVEMDALEVAAGEIHVLTGPNGGGKTSLLRAILGELPFSGSRTLELPGGRPLAYVPQAFHLDATLPLTVGDLLALPLQTRPVFLGRTAAAAAEVEAALEEVGLGGAAERMVGDLSGGELQRVLLAQALRRDPALLLLDEPSRGMDAEGRRVLDAVLERLRAAGAGVLWVAHDQEAIRRRADRVTWMERTMHRTGSPEEVLVQG